MLNLSLEQVMQYAKDYKAVPVAKECLADMLTPLAFLDNVRRSSRNYFLLESIEGGEHWARYSFVGYDPVLRLKITDGNAEIISGAAVKYQENDPLGCIRHILEEYKAPQIDGLPNFTGGLVGTFGFDFMRYCEPDMRVNKERKAEFADVDLMLFDKLIAFDHLKQKIFLIVNVKTDNASINYAKAEREIAAMEEMLLQPVQPTKPVKAKLGEFTSNQSREQYNKNVLRCKEYIKNGDAFQIVYAQKFSATYDQSLFSAYRYLRTTNPSQYMVFLHNDDVEIAGSSPETLVKVVGKRVISMPIAGTRRRGKTSEEDKALEQELLADVKEVAEHNMLVDLGRNDVGRVCDFGSVKVSDYKAIKHFSHVMHITSKVTGQLSADKDALDALRAVFPAGTLSGAPKIRACEIIDELEPERRGIYGGGMGYLDFGGNMDICITIRTMVKKNDRVYIQAGGGIVADSVVDNEFQETVNKAGACMTALRMTAEEE
ncbi:anthranilate synthase component I [Phascolarctobacterium succinatutens]|uniref:anthranilate synthase component I n=1 Tax=Phascolarctobacterium succinatutens TaxID=626940 RepID=UPI0026EADEB4|nr:anthranilate synthase component I [Phascolarctobacterium succinatutens]